MNHDALTVIIEGEPAAIVERTRAGALRLIYDDAYRFRNDATPISVAMPLAVPEHRASIVEPWLRGLLPDDDEVLRRWARHFDLSGRSAFDLLATPIGEDCAGAVQFCTPDRVADVVARPGTIEWLSERDVARRLAELRADRASWLGPDFTGQWSLAGAQAKTALRFEEGRWGDPRGAAATTHILKPAIAGLDDHDLNEHLCLRAASEVGLIVAPSRVERFERTSAIVVERYDRIRVRDEVLRVHQEDACQALGYWPSDKYEADGGPSARQILVLIRGSMPGNVAEDASRRFVDALAWNWIIGGTDAHAKNCSLLLRGDDVRLAPLYDVASILPYADVQWQKLRLAMRIGGESRLGVIAPRHWERVASDAELDPASVLDRIRELASRAPDAFVDAVRLSTAAQPAIAENSLAGRLIEAVAAHAERCRQVLS